MNIDSKDEELKQKTEELKNEFETKVRE